MDAGVPAVFRRALRAVQRAVRGGNSRRDGGDGDVPRERLPRKGAACAGGRRGDRFAGHTAFICARPCKQRAGA